VTKTVRSLDEAVELAHQLELGEKLVVNVVSTPSRRERARAANELCLCGKQVSLNQQGCQIQIRRHS
jgi:hypothetical protein